MLLWISLFMTVASCSSELIRPCSLNNLQCIRRQLADVSNCNPNVRGNLPSEYSLAWGVFHGPFFNATYVDNNLKIRNHNKCFVSEFFYNTESRVIVLSLDCPGLEFESVRTVIQHESYREDTRFSYDYCGLYPIVRLTMNLLYPADLCRSFTFADVGALPIFRVTPNDKKTANYLTTDLSLLNIYEMETFFFRANLLARYYINSYICDFGCDF